MRGRSPASCPRKDRTETARGKRGQRWTGKGASLLLVPAEGGCASRLRGCQAGAGAPGARRPAARVRECPRSPAIRTPAAREGQGDAASTEGAPLWPPCLMRLGACPASSSWGSRRGRLAPSRPPPKTGARPRGQRGPRAVYRAGPGADHAFPAVIVADEFTGRFTEKKKVIWKKAKRAGGVESAGFKEGGTEKEAHPPVLSTAAIPPHRRPFRPRSLPRGARQLCPAPPQRGAPKVTGYLSAQEKFRLPNPSRLTPLTL